MQEGILLVVVIPDKITLILLSPNPKVQTFNESVLNPMFDPYNLSRTEVSIKFTEDPGKNLFHLWLLGKLSSRSST